MCLASDKKAQILRLHLSTLLKRTHEHTHKKDSCACATYYLLYLGLISSMYCVNSRLHQIHFTYFHTHMSTQNHTECMWGVRVRHRNDTPYGKSRKLNTFYTVDNKEQSRCLSLMRDREQVSKRLCWMVEFNACPRKSQLFVCWLREGRFVAFAFFVSSNLVCALCHSLSLCCGMHVFERICLFPLNPQSLCHALFPFAKAIFDIQRDSYRFIFHWWWQWY